MKNTQKEADFPKLVFCVFLLPSDYLKNKSLFKAKRQENTNKICSNIYLKKIEDILLLVS